MIQLLVGGARVRTRCPITRSPAHSLISYWEHIMTQTTCTVDGCSKPRKPESRMCSMHCGRLYRYGRLDLIRRQNGTGNINAAGYVDHHTEGRRAYEHVLVAERALGKRLPPGACVHHINEIKNDNTPSNLVICPNEGYHKLLHRRAAALAACGHADWKRCQHCKQYGAPETMNARSAHIGCAKHAARVRYLADKAKKEARNG